MVDKPHLSMWVCFFMRVQLSPKKTIGSLSSVGKLGADIMSISGRISSGPRCKDMSVTATVTNDNGLKATISDNVSKTNSFGSTIFEGNAKVSGSA